MTTFDSAFLLGFVIAVLIVAMAVGFYNWARYRPDDAVQAIQRRPTIADLVDPATVTMEALVLAMIETGWMETEAEAEAREANRMVGPR